MIRKLTVTTALAAVGVITCLGYTAVAQTDRPLDQTNPTDQPATPPNRTLERTNPTDQPVIQRNPTNLNMDQITVFSYDQDS